MSILTDLLYWISTGLMIPVIVFLLIFFIRALYMLGSFYALYMGRLRFNRGMMNILERVKNEDVNSINFSGELIESGMFVNHLNRLKGVFWHSIHSEKIISDFEIIGEKGLESSKSMMRIGPMLGLMGTLIPMGPALVGLSTGDISSMALNMQVAFSTTVVGIFVGAIGFLLMMVKQRWLSEDMNNLEYIYELANHKRDRNEEVIHSEDNTIKD